MTLLEAKSTSGRSSQAMEAVSFLGDYIPLLIDHRWIRIHKERMCLLTVYFCLACHVIDKKPNVQPTKAVIASFALSALKGKLHRFCTLYVSSVVFK